MDQEIYRQATPLCAVCGAEAIGSCGSCGRAFCGAHLVVEAERRCGDCELEFTRREGRLRRAVGAIFGGSLTAAVIGAVVVGTPWLIVIGGTASAIAGGVGAAVHALKRRRFLRRKAPHGLFDDAQVKIGAKGGEFSSPGRPRSERSYEFGSYRSKGTYG